MSIALSKLVGTVGDSPTLKLNAQARALKEAGHPVIHLGGGEPSFPIPVAAMQAIIDKANKRYIKYTPSAGTPALKKAVIAYTEKYYGRTYQPNQVIISAGAKQALFNFLIAALDPGDEVVFPSPYWVSYPEMIKLAGGVPMPVRGKDPLQINEQELLAALTPNTKAILLNSPCNPSGQIYSETFIKTVVRVAEEKQIFLVMDDIYHQLVFDGKKPANPCAYVREGKNLVLINGVSKLYAMTGVRIGWAVSAHEELIAAMARVQAQSTSCNSDLSEAAAAAALTADNSCVLELRKQLEENRNILLEELSHIPHVKVKKPEGTFYTFADFSHYNPSSQELAQFLLDKALVAVVPGKAFGADGYLRISFCADKTSIIEGIRRIRRALENYAPHLEGSN